MERVQRHILMGSVALAVGFTMVSMSLPAIKSLFLYPKHTPPVGGEGIIIPLLVILFSLYCGDLLYRKHSQRLERINGVSLIALGTLNLILLLYSYDSNRLAVTVPFLFLSIFLLIAHGFALLLGGTHLLMKPSRRTPKG